MPASETGILLQEESAGCAHASEIEMPKLVPYRYGASMFVMVFLIETSFILIFFHMRGSESCEIKSFIVFPCHNCSRIFILAFLPQSRGWRVGAVSNTCFSLKS